MNLIEGNRIVLLKNGEAFFPALEAAIDSALHDVRLETYIFEADTAGIRVAAALMRAAARGVRVCVLVDGFAVRKTPPEFFDDMRKSGVELQQFRPDRGLFDFRRSRVRRVHRKIALMDGHTGFVGGINIIDDYNENLSESHPRYDYAVQVEGPILADIYPSVAALWRVVSWFRLRSENALPLVSLKPVGQAALAFVARDNFRHRRDIEREYWRAISTAKKEILIASPYFLPGRQLRMALIRAARRGVRVEILLQGVADHPLLQMATHALYDSLLNAGIIIHEYQPAMLHGKVAVIDRRWATVGSSNLDPFSLLLNREANIFALDASFAETLFQSVMEEITQNAVSHSVESWQQRSYWQRTKSWLALSFARLVTGFVGVKHD
jgi:cardiolipin synthase A/B